MSKSDQPAGVAVDRGVRPLVEKRGDICTLALYELLADLADEAGAVDTVIGRPRVLHERHGALPRDPETGQLRFGFIHGNWCLANSSSDGRMCGVDDELPVLFETGCYADFTFPAPESDAQPNIVNQIYWPIGNLAERRAYEHGERARVGEVKRDRLLMIEGPTAIGLRPKKMPLRIEMGDVDWDAALALYQQNRVTRTARIVLSGREMGRLYHAAGVERLVRNSLWKGRSQERFYDAMEWLYGWNVTNCLSQG